MKKTNIILFAFAFGLLAVAKAEAPVQPHEAIYSAVKSFLGQQLGSQDYEVELVPLDSQLKLAECPVPLEVFSTGDVIKPGRNSVGVRCPAAAAKWSIFTSVIIKIYQHVLVLALPLQRGDTVSRDHLVPERRDVSALRGDFLTRPEQIEHKQALRPLPAGTVLSLRNFAEPKLVKRGDKIVISAGQANFSIRMSGLAMMDGGKGQLIKIKNQSSGRIINGTVIEPGLVHVND